jgi:hypothetical protein
LSRRRGDIEFDETSAIPLVLKNALSRIATSTEMIDRILTLYPKGTRDPAPLPKCSRQYQIACSVGGDWGRI